MILINLSVAEIEKHKREKEGRKERKSVKKFIDDCAMKNFTLLLFDCTNRCESFV